MSDTEQVIGLLRRLQLDDTAEEEWSRLDALVGDWVERRRRTELVASDALNRSLTISMLD